MEYYSPIERNKISTHQQQKKKKLKIGTSQKVSQQNDQKAY